MKGRVAFLGIGLSLALVVSYVEALLPINFGIPGVKLGLTNIVILFFLYRFGMKDAFCVSLARIFLAGFLFGNLFSILYSLVGGMLSLTVMGLLKKTNLFHVYTVSIMGGISHNLGQLIAAIFVVENLHLFYYFPVLLLSGALTGLLIGIVASEVMKRLPQK